MKHFGIFALLAVIATFAVCESAQSHNVTWGERKAKDGLLQREIFRKKSKFMQVVSSDFKYPNGTVSANKNITQIVVTDQYTNGDGGYATLYTGGPGMKNVTIHCKSQRGHGFNFIIEIYGL